MVTYPVPVRMRQELKKPLGKLILNRQFSAEKLLNSLRNAHLTVAVGDATAEILFRIGVEPDIYVIDGKELRIERKYPSVKYQTEHKVQNPAGTLSDEVLETIAFARKGERPVRIVVDGEEDLLVLPFMATYPDGTYVLYGQPREGLVLIELDEEGRKRARSFLNAMGINLDYRA